MKKLQMTGFARAMPAPAGALVYWAWRWPRWARPRLPTRSRSRSGTPCQAPTRPNSRSWPSNSTKSRTTSSSSCATFGNQDDLKKEAASAVKSKKGPNLVQLADNHSPEVVAEHKAILPLHHAGQVSGQDLNWFLPSTTSFTRDGKGRLLAFPWMAEVPVMFYNTAYYKKAGLDPNKPARTWADLQAELLKLRDVANIDCPYATSDQVTVHLENLAPVNNQLYATLNNGLDVAKKGSPSMQLKRRTKNGEDSSNASSR